MKMNPKHVIVPMIWATKLARAAVEETAHRALDAVEAVAVGAVGEESEAQHAPGAARPVNRDGPTGSSTFNERST